MKNGLHVKYMYDATHCHDSCHQTWPVLCAAVRITFKHWCVHYVPNPSGNGSIVLLTQTQVNLAFIKPVINAWIMHKFCYTASHVHGAKPDYCLLLDDTVNYASINVLTLPHTRRNRLTICLSLRISHMLLAVKRRSISDVRTKIK